MDRVCLRGVRLKGAQSWGLQGLLDSECRGLQGAGFLDLVSASLARITGDLYSHANRTIRHMSYCQS